MRSSYIRLAIQMRPPQIALNEARFAKGASIIGLGVVRLLCAATAESPGC
jgi:hypothetical protein